MKKLLISFIALALALSFAPPVSAAPITLTDGNSVVNVDPTSQAGTYNWIIDGRDILFQQWFWYRVGDTGEQSIDTLGAPAVFNPDPTFLRLTYTPVGLGFTVEIAYTLTGGTPGSHISDIGESIRVTNTGTNPALDFHFFQYSDFDIAPNLIDTVTISPDNRVADQHPASPSGVNLAETIVTPPASHVEANYFANTRNKLNSGLPTTLNDVRAAGPGDVTWAFQWDKVVTRTTPLIISKDKLASPVPEPATLVLAGGCLLLLGRLYSRRSRRAS